jgi:hypothetical protein
MIGEHTWTRITEIENIPVREGRSVEIDGLELAIFNGFVRRICG